MKCHDHIENIGIYLATDLESSHLLDPMYVNSANVDILKKLYEDLGMNEEVNVHQPDGIERELKDLGEDFEK
jgi:hypothetical protein